MNKTSQTKLHFSYPILLLYSIALGLFSGIVTAAFIVIFEKLQHFLWTSLPTSLGIEVGHNAYTIVVCLVGGLILGILLKLLGSHPGTIEEAVEGYKKTKQFDYTHIWQAFVISIISLGFGASLGPEAALTAIIGGLVTLSGIKLHRASLLRYGADIDKHLSQLKRKLLGIIAALAGIWVFSNLGGDDYFNLDLSPYSFSMPDIGWAVIVLIVGITVGAFYLIVDSKLEKQLTRARKDQTIILAAAGGLGLGILAAIEPLALFSGHEGIRTLSENAASQTAWFLASVVVIKIAATSLCLATGWKGGRFFPLMFAGAASGLFVATLFASISPALAIAVGMTGTLAFVLQKPILAAILLFCFFPINLWIFIAAAAVIAGNAGKKIQLTAV